MNLDRILEEYDRRQAAAKAAGEAVSHEHERRVSEVLQSHVEPVVGEACAKLRQHGQEADKHVRTIAPAINGRPEALVMSVTLVFGGYRRELSFLGNVPDLTVTVEMDCPVREGVTLGVPLRLPLADVTREWTGRIVEHFVRRVLGV